MTLDFSTPITLLPITPRMPALIFLNGPAGVGKSTLANRLVEIASHGEIIQYHHASPLWAMLDCLITNEANPNEPFFDYSGPKIKASPISWAGPTIPSKLPTYRDALVSLGQWARDTFGPWALANAALTATRECLHAGFSTIVFPACRTLEDLELLVAAAGSQNCLLIRIFRDGHSFANDLGSYLPERPLGVPTVDLHNSGSLEDFYSAIDRIFEDCP